MNKRPPLFPPNSPHPSKSVPTYPLTKQNKTERRKAQSRNSLHPNPQRPTNLLRTLRRIQQTSRRMGIRRPHRHHAASRMAGPRKARPQKGQIRPAETTTTAPQSNRLPKVGQQKPQAAARRLRAREFNECTRQSATPVEGRRQGEPRRRQQRHGHR